MQNKAVVGKLLDDVLCLPPSEMDISLIDQCLEHLQPNYVEECAPHQKEVLQCIAKHFEAKTASDAHMEMVAELKSAMANGTLIGEEIQRRLEGIIQSELDQPKDSRDLRLVKDCQDMLLTMKLKGRDMLCFDEATNAQAKLKKRLRRICTWRIGVRAMAAATALVLLIAGGILFYREWLTGSHTDDQQQYQIQGVVQDPVGVTQGQADGTEEQTTLVTTDLGEMIAFLGFEPELPMWLPEGWAVVRYSATKGSRFTWVTVDYANRIQEKDMNYGIRRYTDIENAYIAFEQDATGDLMAVESLELYYLTNISRIQVVWQSGNDILDIEGSVSLEDAMQMIKSIGGN